MELEALDREAGGFGARVRQLRRARGLTQEELAERAGLSVRGLSDLERGARRRARPETFALLAHALGLNSTEREGLDRLRQRGPPRLPPGVAPLASPTEREQPPYLSLVTPPTAVPSPRPGAPRHNLPLPTTTYIARAGELAQVAQRLREARLLTISGSGGCGKTRLALEVARAAVDDFADGAWLVELAPLNDPLLVPQAIASALELRATSGRPLLAALADYLQTRQLLLILDNCEHLIDACARAVEALLRSCARLRILATSREGLGIAGEAIWRVPGLSAVDLSAYPAGDAALVGAVLVTEAARLFVDRARAVVPAFALTARNARAVAQVCSQLDGIPLALELAAARLTGLSVHQLAARLDARFHLLTGGPRTADPRQRTLRATIDWSYQLLTGPERMLLRRLAAFAGGWSLEAAEAVVADEALPAGEVLDGLTHLAAKSLVLVEETDEGDAPAARYRFLETIRQYAAERLDEAGEAAAVRLRHREWFITLAEQAEVALRGPEQFAWLRRLDAELDNLRAALGRSLAAADGAEAALRLVGALAPWQQARGDLTEGKAWLVRALTRKDMAAPAVRAKALGNGAWLAFRQGDYDLARALADELLTLSRERGDRRGTLAALRTLAVTAGERVGDADTADALERESLAICAELGECWETAQQRYILAVGRNRCRDFATARAYLEASLAMLRKLGDRHTAMQALAQLAVAARGQGDDERAEALLLECLEAQRAWGNQTSASFCLAQLAAVARARGDLPTARARLDESLRLSWEAGDRPVVARLLHQQAGLAVAASRIERGVRLFGAAEAFRVALGVTWILPAERAEYEADLAAARRQLDAVTFACLWTEGRALMPEQAVADALRPEPRCAP